MKGRALWVGAALLALVLIGSVLFADVAKLAHMARSFPWWRVALALLLATLNYALRGLRFRAYMSALGTRLTVVEAFLVFVAGLLFTVTPGKMGEIFKGWLLRERRATPLTQTTTAVIAERVTDVLGLLILASAGVWHYGTQTWLFGLIASGTLGGLLLVAHPRALPVSLRWARDRWAPGRPRLRAVIESLGRVQDALRVLCSVRLLLVGVSLATLGWGLEALAYRLILDGLGAGGDLGGATVIYAMATLFGAASMLPGGVGGTEALFVALALQPAFGFGLDADGATFATLLIRFATLWWAVLLGGLCVPMARRVLRAELAS